MADIVITKAGAGRCYVESNSYQGLKWIISNIAPKDRNYIKTQVQVSINSEHVEDFISEILKDDITVETR